MGKLSFGTTGYSYQVDKVNLGLGGAPTCSRCSQRVYFNEEKRAIGKVWHTRCFTCAKCHKGLDSTNCNGHEDEVFCTACHRREFGPKGYGFAGGASGLSTESSVRKPRPVEKIQTTTVPAKIPAENVDTNDPSNCGRCGKKVYFAEEVLALNRKWHKLCFKCRKCNHPLQPGFCNEHDDSLYCNSCYGKNFGPTGYGYAGGNGTLLSSETQPRRSTPPQQKIAHDQPIRSGGNEWTESVYI